MGKRIVAMIGVVLLVLMYIASLVAAIMARPEAHQIFLATLVLTVVIPIVLWIYIRLYAAAHDKKNGMSLQELRKYNKRLKSGESSEKLAKEIEETYQKEEE